MKPPWRVIVNTGDGYGNQMHLFENGVTGLCEAVSVPGRTVINIREHPESFQLLRDVFLREETAIEDRLFFALYLDNDCK